MEIHKPKAAHSFRDFLIEIGTIVCGILIALGLEQAVEAVHRDAEIRETREALDGEVAHDLGAYQHFLAHRTCVNQRFDEINAWLDSPAAKHARRFPATLPDPNFIFGSSSTWSISNNSVSKMPLSLKSQYSTFYAVLAVDQKNFSTFFNDWGNLQRYLDSEHLTDQTRDDIRFELKALRSLGDVQLYNYKEFTQPVADRLHLTPNPEWISPDLKARAAEMCKPLFASSARR